MASDSGYHGQGTYFASNACKSHQYSKKSSNANGMFMIIARVSVGQIYYTKSVCREAKLAPQKNDSIVANAGPMTGHNKGKQAHQEIVIFDRNSAYPEFVVKYRV
jgi:hypothetical protein